MPWTVPFINPHVQITMSVDTQHLNTSTMARMHRNTQEAERYSTSSFIFYPHRLVLVGSTNGFDFSQSN